MNLPKIITGLLLISIVAGSSWAQSSTANWYSALPAAAAGSPWTLEVLSSSSSGSRLLLECPGFWSEQIFQDGQFRSKVYLPGSAGSTTSIGLPELPSIGRLLAIPADRDVDVIIHEISTQTFPCENPCLSESSEGTNQVPLEPLQQAGVFPSVWASASPPVIMKDYRLAPIVLNPIRYDFDAKQLVVATRLEVEFRTAELSDQNVKTYFPPASEAFRPIYEGVILDQTEYNTATPLVAEGSRGKYLIFIAENLTNSFFLNNFMTWKRQLGYQVILKPLTTANNGKEQIKAAIMEEYYAGDAQLDYVLLVGDPNNGVVTIPAFDIYKPPNNTEVDPTDHSYALLEGQDYFPDVMVGRLSITSTIELSIALNKILSYQKNPYLTDPNWFKKALLAAGNYSDTPPAPITPAWVTLWLMDKLHDYGYT
ncbi:MAG TPA: C25 family cysteine peptidase, partial [bacterium]